MMTGSAQDGVDREWGFPLDPLVHISSEKGSSEVALYEAGGEGGDGSPRVFLGAGRRYSRLGVRFALYSNEYEVIFEEPMTVLGLADQLTERLVDTVREFSRENAPAVGGAIPSACLDEALGWVPNKLGRVLQETS